MLVPESNVSDIPLAETEKGSLLVGGYIDARVSHAAIFTPAQLLQRNAAARPQPATRTALFFCAAALRVLRVQV